MDDGEFDGEPSDHDGIAAPSIPIEDPSNVLATASEAIPTRPVAAKPSAILEPTLTDPATRVEPSSTATDPNEDVGN